MIDNLLNKIRFIGWRMWYGRRVLLHIEAVGKKQEDSTWFSHQEVQGKSKDIAVALANWAIDNDHNADVLMMAMTAVMASKEKELGEKIGKLEDLLGDVDSKMKGAKSEMAN